MITVFNRVIWNFANLIYWLLEDFGYDNYVNYKKWLDCWLKYQFPSRDHIKLVSNIHLSFTTCWKSIWDNDKKCKSREHRHIQLRSKKLKKNKNNNLKYSIQIMISSPGRKKCNLIKIIEKLENIVHLFQRILARVALRKSYTGQNLQRLHSRLLILSKFLIGSRCLNKLMIKLDLKHLEIVWWKLFIFPLISTRFKSLLHLEKDTI